MSWCGSATTPRGLGQGSGAQLLDSGSRARAWSCPVVPVPSVLAVLSRERRGRCAWVGRGARLRAPQQGSARHGELAAPKLQLCTAGTRSPALLCPLPRPCVGPILLGGLRQASRPLPVRGQPCRSRRSLPGTAVLGAKSSTRGAGGRSGRRCGR